MSLDDYDGLEAAGPTTATRPARGEAWRFVKYSLVGFSNGALDFITLAILVVVFDPQRDLAVVAMNSVAFLVGVVNSYTLNSRFTFGTPRPFASHWFGLFLLINLGSLLISNVSLLSVRWLMEEIVGLEGRAAILAAKPPSGIALAAYGYLAYRKLFLGSAAGGLLSRLWRGRGRRSTGDSL